MTVGLEVGWLVGEKLGATLEGLLVTVTVGESVGETVELNVGEEVGLQVTYAAKTSPSVPPQPVSSDITLFKKTKLGMQIVLCIQTGFCIHFQQQALKPPARAKLSLKELCFADNP